MVTRIARTDQMNPSVLERLNVSCLFIFKKKYSFQNNEHLIIFWGSLLKSVDLESDVLIDEMLEDPLLAAGGNETLINPDTTFNPDKCPLGELLCMSGSTCIRFEQLCDGTRDCADGADETDCGKPSGPE
jgi:hypothetical protein